MIAPDVAAFDRLLAMAAGWLRVITLAPELPGATDLITAAAEAGVIAAVGHTDATADVTAAAVDAGASHATHLFNGMGPLHHRRPGLPGAALGEPRLVPSIIADFVHVHPVLVYYAAVQGSGVTFQDIFDLLGGDADSGIMVGEQRFEFTRPLEVDREYTVEGGIVDVVRKEGRRAGVFDIATCELRLLEPGGGEPVAVSTTSFVFPRREGSE